MPQLVCYLHLQRCGCVVQHSSYFCRKSASGLNKTTKIHFHWSYCVTWNRDMLCKNLKESTEIRLLYVLYDTRVQIIFSFPCKQSWIKRFFVLFPYFSDSLNLNSDAVILGPNFWPQTNPFVLKLVKDIHFRPNYIPTNFPNSSQLFCMFNLYREGHHQHSEIITSLVCVFYYAIREFI